MEQKSSLLIRSRWHNSNVHVQRNPKMGHEERSKQPKAEECARGRSFLKLVVMPMQFLYPSVA